jgi:hypothetical protein
MIKTINVHKENGPREEVTAIKQKKKKKKKPLENKEGIMCTSHLCWNSEQERNPLFPKKVNL